MQARAPLMIEHRLIERMVSLITDAMVDIESTHTVNTDFIKTAVDFIRTYADRAHHGKEEDILFSNLRTRSLSDEDERMMNELIREHVFSRETTSALADASERYSTGDMSAVADVTDALRALVDLYPKHIEKEDTFFSLLPEITSPTKRIRKCFQRSVNLTEI